MVSFKYSEGETCSCGDKADYEIATDSGSVHLCNDCMRQVAAGYFGITKLYNEVNGEDATTKPNSLYKDIGDITFEKSGENVTVDPFVCSDYSPAIYFRNTKKYVKFDWSTLVDISINIGGNDKE